MLRRKVVCQLVTGFLSYMPLDVQEFKIQDSPLALSSRDVKVVFSVKNVSVRSKQADIVNHLYAQYHSAVH